MRDAPLPDTLAQMMRELRNRLAAQPRPGDPELDTVMEMRHMALTMVDYAHHLEARVAYLEKKVQSFEPVIHAHGRC